MADINRYLNLITSQHQNKPKFTAWLSAHLGIINDATALAENFNSYFDIDVAIGAQLDILGQILGVARTVTFQPTDGSSPILTDVLYRLVLRAKILKNQWDGTIAQLYSLWNTIFPDAFLIIRDNQDMTLNALIIGLSTQMEKDLTTYGYIVPRPQGVSMTFSYSSNPFFAYDMETSEFKGYDEGYWAQYL